MNFGVTSIVVKERGSVRTRHTVTPPSLNFVACNSRPVWGRKRYGSPPSVFHYTLEVGVSRGVLERGRVGVGRGGTDEWEKLRKVSVVPVFLLSVVLLVLRRPGVQRSVHEPTLDPTRTEISQGRPVRSPTSTSEFYRSLRREGSR